MQSVKVEKIVSTKHGDNGYTLKVNDRFVLSTVIAKSRDRLKMTAEHIKQRGYIHVGDTTNWVEV